MEVPSTSIQQIHSLTPDSLLNKPSESKPDNKQPTKQVSLSNDIYTSDSNSRGENTTTYTRSGTIERPDPEKPGSPKTTGSSGDDTEEAQANGANKDDTGETEEVNEQNNNKPVKTEQDLSDKESQEVRELKARDVEVKAHERAHVAAGGQHVTKGATFEYETGPDGKRYAVGGEVGISVSEVPDNPEATIKKMQVVKNAALAPASPSSQDRAVAAKASRIEMQARTEALAELQDTNSSTGSIESSEIRDEKDKEQKTVAGIEQKGRSLDIFA